MDKVRIIYDGGVWDSDIHGDLIPPIDITLGDMFTAGTVKFTVDNNNFNYNDTFVPYRDLEVYLAAGSAGTLQKVFLGRVKKIRKNHRGGKSYITIEAADYRDILMKREVRDSFVNGTTPCTVNGCEISALVKDIVQRYGQGKIDTTTYVQATNKYYAVNAGDSIQITGKNAWDAVRDLALAAAYVAWIDQYGNLHFEPRVVSFSGVVLSDNPGSGEHRITRMDNIEIDGDRIATRVIVFGNGIIKQADSIEGINNYGIIEERYTDTNITDATWAKDIAKERVGLFSQIRESYSLDVAGFINVQIGQSVKVTHSGFGLLEKELVVQGIKYRFGRDLHIMTTLTLGEAPVKYIDFIRKLSEEVVRLKQQNQGTGTVDDIKQFYDTVRTSDVVDKEKIDKSTKTYCYAGTIVKLLFNDAAGATVTDMQNGNNGAINGTATWVKSDAETAGAGYALELDGSTGYVQVNIPSQTLQNFTLEARFKHLGDNEGNLVALYTGGGYGSALAITGGKLIGYLADAGVDKSTRLAGTTTLVTNTWYEARMTYDGANLKLWLRRPGDAWNAEATLAVAYTFTGATTYFYVGADAGGGYGYLNARFDFVRVQEGAIEPTTKEEASYGFAQYE